MLDSWSLTAGKGQTIFLFSISSSEHIQSQACLQRPKILLRSVFKLFKLGAFYERDSAYTTPWDHHLYGKYLYCLITSTKCSQFVHTYNDICIIILTFICVCVQLAFAFIHFVVFMHSCLRWLFMRNKIAPSGCF